MLDSYRDIIVYLDASSYTEDRLELAAAMAQQHGAKMTGVDISTNAAFEGNWRDRAAEIGDRFDPSLGLGAYLSDTARRLGNR